MERDDTDVAIDANVTSDQPTPPTAEPVADKPQQRVWSLPKSPVSREQADEAGRVALNAAKGGARLLAGAARFGAGVARKLVLAIESVPPTVRVLALMGILMLTGIVGAITLPGPLGLACIVVVVPVCSIALGALGHRWYSGLGGRTEGFASAVSDSDLQRSVEYVDKKLTFALNAFGAERQQHAMIALFQAKTAVELTLGTEQDVPGHVEALLSIDDARPRIRAGSLAAS